MTSDAGTGQPLRLRSRADLLCGAGVIGGIVLAYVLLGLTPTLLAHHAVLLEALAGNTASIVTGGAYARIGRDPLLLVLAAPLACIALYDVFAWWAGRRWGNAIALGYFRRSPRAIRWIDRTERLIARRGSVAVVFAYFLPVPNFLIYLLCGASGMSLAVFVVADVVGTLLWDGLLVGLGWAIGHPAIRVVNAINHYSLFITIGLVVIFVGASVRRGRQARRVRPRPPAPATATEPD